MPVTIHRVHAGRTQIRRRLQRTTRAARMGTDGSRLLINASAPATCGAAKEVPSPTVMSVLPVFAAELMSTPGAAKHQYLLLLPQPLEKPAMTDKESTAATTNQRSVSSGSYKGAKA